MGDAPCECHYAGTTPSLTPDDTEKMNKEWDDFDSGYKRGSTTSFAPNQVIKGWTEAMQLMVEGDKWEMYIPSDLAYGDRGSPPKIPGGSALIFRMEIIKINGDKVPASRCDPGTGKGCDDKAKKYIEKMAKRSAELIKKEIARLQKLQASKAKPKLLNWMGKRVNILGKMLKNAK